MPARAHAGGARLTTQHAFETLRLHRIEAACIPDNLRSLPACLKKAGFQREGCSDPTSESRDMQDHYLYALVVGDRPAAPETGLTSLNCVCGAGDFWRLPWRYWRRSRCPAGPSAVGRSKNFARRRGARLSGAVEIHRDQGDNFSVRTRLVPMVSSAHRGSRPATTIRAATGRSSRSPTRRPAARR